MTVNELFTRIYSTTHLFQVEQKSLYFNLHAREIQFKPALECTAESVKASGRVWNFFEYLFHGHESLQGLSRLGGEVV